MATALELHHVWKKFHRGEFNDCLRDAIPAMVKGLFGLGPKRDELAAKDFWALSDIDFRVEQGETLGIIGHNGAGKSTLLKILSNIIAPNRGSMRVNGRLRALIEIGAGFHGDLTGRENIYLNGAILGMTRAEIQKNFDSIVDFSGVEEFLDMPVKRYSSGMAARLGFAVAAHLEPEILIVDEVLSVGDTQFQKKCLGKMSDVAGDGRTVLFVSHNMGAVRNLCKRTILLQKGNILADGFTEDVIEDYYTQLQNQQKEMEIQCRNRMQKAYISRVLLGNSFENLQDVGNCECNGPFCVRIFYNVNETIDDCFFSFVCIDGEGNHLIGMNTLITPKSIGKVTQNGYVDFYMPKLPLVAGFYGMSFGLFERKSSEGYGFRVDHYTQNRCLYVSRVDTPEWQFTRGYSQKCFVPYEWEQKTINGN